MGNVIQCGLAFAGLIIAGMVLAKATVCSQGTVSVPREVEHKINQAAEVGLRGDYATAIQMATEVIDRHPRYVLAYLLRGTANRKSGDFTQAISDLDRAIELDPQTSNAYTQRAWARQMRPGTYRSDEVFADLDQAIALEPSNALAHLLRGNELLGLDEFDAAVVEYEQALLHNPKSCNAHASRGMARLGLGQIDLARKDLRTALAMNPSAEDRVLFESQLQVLE